VDLVRPGEPQSEIDHHVQGVKSDPMEGLGRKLRHAHDGGWFAYEMKVDGTVPNELVCNWWGDESGQRNFDILVDGVKIGAGSLSHWRRPAGRATSRASRSRRRRARRASGPLRCCLAG